VTCTTGPEAGTPNERGAPLPRVWCGLDGLGVQQRLDGMDAALTTTPRPVPEWLEVLADDWRQRTARVLPMLWEPLNADCEEALAAYVPADPGLAALLRANRSELADLVRAGRFDTPDQCRRALLALLRFMRHHRLSHLDATALTGDAITAALHQVRESRGSAGAMLVALGRIAGMANPSFSPPLPTIGAEAPTPPCPPDEAAALLTALTALPRGLRRISALTIYHGSRGAGLQAPDFRYLRGDWITSHADHVIIDVVDGPSPRRVVVAVDHAQRLLELAATVGDGFLVAPNRDGSGGKNLVANVLGWVNRQLGGGLTLDPVAQRHAFIAAHLAAGTPLPLLQFMCGGISARTITALLPRDDSALSDDEFVARGTLTEGAL
jgi:hypothetical protein